MEESLSCGVRQCHSSTAMGTALHLSLDGSSPRRSLSRKLSRLSVMISPPSTPRESSRERSRSLWDSLRDRFSGRTRAESHAVPHLGDGLVDDGKPTFKKIGADLTGILRPGRSFIACDMSQGKIRPMMNWTGKESDEERQAKMKKWWNTLNAEPQALIKEAPLAKLEIVRLLWTLTQLLGEGEEDLWKLSPELVAPTTDLVEGTRNTIETYYDSNPHSPLSQAMEGFRQINMNKIATTLKNRVASQAQGKKILKQLDGHKDVGDNEREHQIHFVYPLPDTKCIAVQAQRDTDGNLSLEFIHSIYLVMGYGKAIVKGTNECILRKSGDDWEWDEEILQWKVLSAEECHNLRDRQDQSQANKLWWALPYDQEWVNKELQKIIRSPIPNKKISSLTSRLTMSWGPQS